MALVSSSTRGGSWRGCCSWGSVGFGRIAGCCCAVQLRRRLRPERPSRPPGWPSPEPERITLLSCRKSNPDEAKTATTVRGCSIAVGDEPHPEHRRPQLPRDQEL